MTTASNTRTWHGEAAAAYQAGLRDGAAAERDKWGAALTRLHYALASDEVDYNVCAECCLQQEPEDDGDLTAECLSAHDHGHDKPICATAAVIDRLMGVRQP